MSLYRKRYHRDLSELKSLDQKILPITLEQPLEKSVIALTDSNVELAREIIKQDQEMDDLSQKIENLCMVLSGRCSNRWPMDLKAHYRRPEDRHRSGEDRRPGGRYGQITMQSANRFR